MTLIELQKKVDDWIKAYGVRYFDEMTNSLVLVEEVGELARLMARKYGEQSFKSQSEAEKADDLIKEEMADILFVLTCLSNQMNIDLEEAIRINLHKKSTRDKMRHVNNPKLKDS